MRIKLSALVLILALSLAFAPSASAHEYDRENSDMWLRYVAYIFHPIGIALEYAVARPIHWVVSQPNLDIWFGHVVSEDVVYDYYEWQ